MRRLVIISGIGVLLFLGILSAKLAYGGDWASENGYGSSYGYIPAYPFYQQYRAEMYRHRGYWRGFRDPVPRGYTSKPVPTWNYRIIRQMERDRIRKERQNGTDWKSWDSRRNYNQNW